ERKKKTVERVRMERALLTEILENQIPARTTESEGTPSPPPTVSLWSIWVIVQDADRFALEAPSQRTPYQDKETKNFKYSRYSEPNRRHNTGARSESGQPYSRTGVELHFYMQGKRR